MFRLIKLLFWVAALAALVWFATTQKLGNYTLWGHLKRVWKSQETQEMVQSTEEAAKPAIKKVKKAVKAGVDEAQRSP
jgi:hypothetical protein